MARLKFSIITPYLPPRPTLQRAIACVDNQYYQDWEHIIMVDDPDWMGSSDDIRRRYVNCEKTHGSFGNHCRNQAWDLCTGDYILYLDDDDILHPNCLQVIDAGLEFNDYEWGYFAITRMGERFFHYPPRFGLITALQIFHKRIINGQEVRWADNDQYGNDWEIVQRCLLDYNPLRIDSVLGDLPEHHLGLIF